MHWRYFVKHRLFERVEAAALSSGRLELASFMASVVDDYPQLREAIRPAQEA